MRSLLICLLIVFSTLTLSAQLNNSDDALADSVKIIALNAQAAQYITLEPDSGIFYGEQALKIGYRIKHYENLNESHRILGWCYYNQQNFYKTKFHFTYALNDTLLSVFEKETIYEALVISSEKTGDYLNAYINSKKLSQLKDSANLQKQNEIVLELKNQITIEKQDQTDELKAKEKIWQMNKTRQQQLLVIAAILLFALMLLAITLFVLLSRNKKHFNNVIEEKNIAILENNEQNKKLQDQLLDYEKLKVEIERNQRENRIQKITSAEPKSTSTEEKKAALNIVDQYKNSSEDEKRKLQPRLESFVTIIPTQLQIIEQAFARHDWELINNTLQTMKSIVHAAGLYPTEILINEIDEHVNANATNRAVVKLMHVKSACTKTVVAIREILIAG